MPHDFSVIGCDDVLISRVLTPPLSTIAAPIGSLGQVAVDVLDELITDAERPPRVRRLRGTLVDRGTTAAPPGRPADYLR